MKLPKRDLPQYTTDLPVSGVKGIKYRPHTIKEEQILNMASLSDNEDDKLAAVVQICENCVDYDISKLFPAEVEYLFMKIKACSDTPKIPVIFAIEPEIDPETGENIHKDCGDSIESTFDINTDVYIEDNGKMTDYATRGKDGTWLVDLNQGIKLVVRVRALTEMSDESIFDLTESVIDEVEDTISYKDIDYNKKEFLDWVDSIDSSAFIKFKSFMTETPTCIADLEFKCKCGKIHKEKEYGVLRFLV